MWRLHCSIRQLVVFSAKLAHNSNKPLRLRTLLIEISMGFEIHCALASRRGHVRQEIYGILLFSLFLSPFASPSARSWMRKRNECKFFSLVWSRRKHKIQHIFFLLLRLLLVYSLFTTVMIISHERLRSPRTTKKNPFLQIFFLCIQISVSLSFHLFLHW